MFRSLSAPTGCTGGIRVRSMGVLHEFHQQLPMDKERKSRLCLEGSARSFPREQPHNDFSKQRVMD